MPSKQPQLPRVGKLAKAMRAVRESGTRDGNQVARKLPKGVEGTPMGRGGRRQS